MILSRLRNLLVVVAAGVTFGSCGGGSPANPNPGPSATPAPTPAPTPTPIASNCPAVRWVEGQSYGRKEYPHFLDQLIVVQDRVFAANPGLFAKDLSGAPDPVHLKDNSVPTTMAYYASFVEQGRLTAGLCVSYAPNQAGVPDATNTEEIWIGVAGSPIDAFRLTATTPPAPVIRRYIATNYIKGYGL